MNLTNITKAKGLEKVDADLITNLVRVLNKNEAKHIKRRKYYDDCIDTITRGMKIPPEYENVDFCTGWAKKAVNSLAERSVFDSYTFNGETPEAFEDVMRANRISELFQMATPAVMRDGLGFWNISAGGQGEPRVIVNFNDPMTASALWNFKQKRIRAGFVIEDWNTFGTSLTYIPSLCVLKNENYNVILRRVSQNEWTAEYERPHNLGTPMLVPLAYKPLSDKPFGQSRITRAVMTYIDMAQEELRNASIQSDFFSIPMKYILGASDEQYEAITSDIYRAYRTDLLTMTLNDADGNPNVGMLQAASMEPHIAVLDKLASMMASETSLPVATFGVAGNGYTSSDALRAANDDIVILAKNYNKTAQIALTEVAKMVLCVLNECDLEQLSENDKSVMARFADPSMPSDAANADAMVKVVSAVPQFAGTDVFWEKLGYDESERKRINQDMASNQQLSIAASVFGA